MMAFIFMLYCKRRIALPFCAFIKVDDISSLWILRHLIHRSKPDSSTYNNTLHLNILGTFLANNQDRDPLCVAQLPCKQF